MPSRHETPTARGHSAKDNAGKKKKGADGNMYKSNGKRWELVQTVKSPPNKKQPKPTKQSEKFDSSWEDLFKSNKVSKKDMVDKQSDDLPKKGVSWGKPQVLTFAAKKDEPGLSMEEWYEFYKKPGTHGMGPWKNKIYQEEKKKSILKKDNLKQDPGPRSDRDELIAEIAKKKREIKDMEYAKNKKNIDAARQKALNLFAPQNTNVNKTMAPPVAKEERTKVGSMYAPPNIEEARKKALAMFAPRQ
jgi:hypothetical protein